MSNKIISLLLRVLVLPAKLSVSGRGRILLWLDGLARLSIIDAFTMVLGVAITLACAGGPDNALGRTEDALHRTKFIVIPGVGFRCIVIAQRMSLVSSHYFVDYRQRVNHMENA